MPVALAAAPDTGALSTPTPPVPVGALRDIATGLAAATDPVGPDPTDRDRRSTRLLATPDYEAWLLTWPAGTGIEPHDHGESHGVFVVLSGELLETNWFAGRTHERSLRAGAVSTVTVGQVHGVACAGEETAVSVHVYSPPLTEMRFFDENGSSVIGVEPVEPAVGFEA